MRAWILSLAILLVHSPVVMASSNPLIKVRLHSLMENVEIEGVGIHFQGRQSAFEFVALPRTQKFKIQRQILQGKNIWKIVGPRATEILTDPVLAIRASSLYLKGKLLPNQIFLSPRKSRFDLVGVLPLEDYLVGVIASEMPLSWPLETLKAQAIAARSYALATMRERSRRHFHVESTVLDQVFSHIGSGHSEDPLVKKAKSAIQATEGLVLLSDKRQLLKAYYHADCGGKTSDAKTVWGFGVSTGSAMDSSCPSNPRAHWNLTLSEEALRGKLQRFLKMPELGNLVVLNLIRPSPQERIEKIRIGFDSGKQMTVSAQAFREALGYDQLRSTFFDLKKKDGEYQFKGKGFGHGVGLCQWGARHLGQEGFNFNEILKHYYPRAYLARTGQEPEGQIR